LSTLPYSLKVLESYDNLTKDIISILGTAITFKMMCIERSLEGIFPHYHNKFGLEFTDAETRTLENVWKKFETKHPLYW